jgi:hypothetical protein
LPKFVFLGKPKRQKDRGAQIQAAGGDVGFADFRLMPVKPDREFGSRVSKMGSVAEERRDA